MISGSNNNYQVSNNRPVSSTNSVVPNQGTTTDTMQVTQPAKSTVQASSVSFLGPISDFISQVWSSIKNFIGGIFNRSSASTGVAAQSLSSSAQQVVTTPTVTAPANTGSVTPEAPVAVTSPAPLKISLSGSGAQAQSTQTTPPAQTNQNTQNASNAQVTQNTASSSNIANMLHQFSQGQTQTTTSQTQTQTQTQTQVVSAQTTVQPMAITPSLKKAASDALPEVDRLISQFALLKPALDLFQVKKPSADEILSYLMEAKIAISQISQGQQPSVHGSGLADFGKKTFKFSNDALRIVMTAKGLAQLFNYKDASFTKGVSEAEKSLIDIRVFSDILARSVQ